MSFPMGKLLCVMQEANRKSCSSVRTACVNMALGGWLYCICVCVCERRKGLKVFVFWLKRPEMRITLTVKYGLKISLQELEKQCMHRASFIKLNAVLYARMLLRTIYTNAMFINCSWVNCFIKSNGMLYIKMILQSM